MSVEHMVRVLKHSESEHGARLVMVVLANYANDRDETYPSVPTIGHEAKLSDRAVQNALRKLLDEGEIKLLDGLSRWGTKRYELTVKTGGAESAGGAESDAVGVQNEVSQTAPNPTTLFNPTTNTTPTPTDLDIVWAHYQKVHPNGSRYKLDAERRRVIANALKVRSVEDCCRAISGLFMDKFFMDGGYTAIKYALRGSKGESPEDRIDRMAEQAPQRAGSLLKSAEVLARVPAGQKDMVGQRMRDVRLMQEGMPDRSTNERGSISAQWLLDHLHISPQLSADGSLEGWVTAAK